MFPPGGAELAVILLLALIVFGPKKLPEIGKSIGQGLRELRKASREITDSLNVMGDDDTSYSSTRSDTSLDTSLPLSEDRPEMDMHVETTKENEQDAADSLDPERTGVVDCPCDSSTAVRSEEASGDREVDGGGDSRVQESIP